MKRKSIYVVLTALLFTVVIISCKKESSPIKESPNQVPGAVAAQTGKPGVDTSSLKGSRVGAAYSDGLEPVPIYEYYNSTCQCRMLSPNTSLPGYTRIGSSFSAYLNDISHLGTMPMYEYGYANPYYDDFTYSPNPNDPNILSYPGWHLGPTTPVFYVYSGSTVVGSIPVYRYYNASETSTLFTSNSRIHLDYAGWVSYGIAWYAAAPQ